MHALQERFGKPHPELVDFVEPQPVFHWLIQAYFRLHRRRHFSDMGGMQPIPYSELTVYAGKVQRIDRSLEPLFYRSMEATDNAVLYDYSERMAKRQAAEKEKAENARRPGQRPSQKRR